MKTQSANTFHVPLMFNIVSCFLRSVPHTKSYYLGANGCCLVTWNWFGKISGHKRKRLQAYRHTQIHTNTLSFKSSTPLGGGLSLTTTTPQNNSMKKHWIHFSRARRLPTLTHNRQTKIPPYLIVNAVVFLVSQGIGLFSFVFP